MAAVTRSQKLDQTGFQGVLCPHHSKSLILNQLLEYLRPMPQVIHRGADIRPDSLGYQRLQIMLQVSREESLD